MTRKYSSISVETTLANSITSTDTLITVAAGTASTLLGGVTLAPANADIFTVALDPDTSNEEIVYITANSGNDFTITRHQAGSSAISHASGATVRHVLTSSDLDYFRDGVSSADTAIPKSIVTTKGDVIAASGASTPVRVALGSNGQVLTADSTQTAGVKWATPTTLDLAFNAQTGTTYTPIAGDVNKLITMSNASASTLVIPNGVFTAGQSINVQQIGAGQVTIQSDGTTVLTSNAGVAPKLRAQYSAATIICTSTNNFTVIGDLA